MRGRSQGPIKKEGVGLQAPINRQNTKSCQKYSISPGLCYLYMHTASLSAAGRSSYYGYIGNVVMDVMGTFN